MNFKTRADKVSAAVSLTLGSFLIIFPFIISMVLFLSRNKLSDENVQKRIGTLYIELEYDSKYALTYYPLFLARRVLYIFLIFEMADKRAIAVMINMLVCIIFTAYVILIRPFKN